MAFPHLCWFTLRYPRWLLKKQGSLPPQPLTQSQAWHPGCTICPCEIRKTKKCGIATFVSENYLETSRWFDNFWWFLMFSDGFWWVFDGFWWFLIVFDGFWWFLMVSDGLWWFMMVCGSHISSTTVCFPFLGLLPDPILCIIHIHTSHWCRHKGTTVTRTTKTTPGGIPTFRSMKCWSRSVDMSCRPHPCGAY